MNKKSINLNEGNNKDQNRKYIINLKNWESFKLKVTLEFFIR